MFLESLQPSAELFNLRIDEPVTTATDMVMTAVCFVAFIGIGNRAGEKELHPYFRSYFLTLGLGAFFGGILGHAFLYRLDPHWKLLSWILILISVAILVHTLIQIARPMLGQGVIRWLTLINLVALAAACYFTIRSLMFRPVSIYAAFGMVVMAGSLISFLYIKTRNRCLHLLMLAVGLGIAAGLVFSFEWAPSPWFNHSDISHLLLSISAWFIYRGAVLILREHPLAAA